MNTQFSKLISATVKVCAIVVVAVLLLADIAEARGSRSRGGSFGGSRRSSPSRTYSQPKPSTSQPKSSFSSRQKADAPAAKSSFGGKRLSSGNEYRKSYGVPRKSEPVRVAGASSPYVVHRYGGMSDGFMMGYLMGSTSMWWSTPFHPAFYYSRPYYATNPDGSTEVYPPRISWTTIILTLLVVGGITYVIVRVIRKRRQQYTSASSFS